MVTNNYDHNKMMMMLASIHHMSDLDDERGYEVVFITRSSRVRCLRSDPGLITY